MRTASKLLALAAGAVLSAPALALNIFACEPEWAALARQLAPQATVFSATHAWQDPHYIEARPSLISKLRRADIAFCSGAELEAGWLPALQNRASNPDVQNGAAGMFFAADVVETIEKHKDALIGRGHVHAEGNPHVHLDPDRLATIAGKFSLRLQQIDADNTAEYRQAHARWSQHWRQKKLQWKQQSLALRGKTIVVQHSTFSYLWRWLKVKPVADLEPVPGVAPTLSHLDGLVSQLKDAQPLAVVHTWHQNDKSARWLSERTGIPALNLPATVSDEAGKETGGASIATLAEYFDYLIARLRAVNSGTPSS